MVMAIATVVSARLILLLAGIGAFVLAFLSLPNPSTAALMVNGIYDLVVFVPLIWLYASKG